MKFVVYLHKVQLQIKTYFIEVITVFSPETQLKWHPYLKV